MFSNPPQGPPQESSSPTLDLQLERYLSQSRHQPSQNPSVSSLSSSPASQFNWNTPALDSRYESAAAAPPGFGTDFSDSFNPWIQPRRSDAPFDTSIQLSFTGSNLSGDNQHNHLPNQASIPPSISRRQQHRYHPYTQHTGYQQGPQDPSYHTFSGVSSLNHGHGPGRELLHSYLDQSTWNVLQSYTGMPSSSTY